MVLNIVFATHRGKYNRAHQLWTKRNC